jgi:hypothetical protein
VINADLQVTPILLAEARAVRRPARHLRQTPGRLAPDRGADRPRRGHRGARRHAGRPCCSRSPAPGRHFALNALGALAAAEALGADPVIAAARPWPLGAARGPRHARTHPARSSVEETFFDLIDDAFNANPASLAAALDVLIAAQPVDGIGRVGGGRRIAILGDMLELGPTEIDLHRAIARHPGLAAMHTIHCVGPRMRALHEALPRGQRGEWVETAPELAARARSLFDAGDILLVKGSKGIKVSLVVDALRKLGQAASETRRGPSEMLYWLTEFSDGGGVFNLFRYITFRAGAAFCHRADLRLPVRPPADRPAAPQAGQGPADPRRRPAKPFAKAGTPTMGGLLILSALMVSTLLWARLDNPYVWIVLLVTLAFGLIGFADDYAKVTKQNTKGVSSRVRFLRAW